MLERLNEIPKVFNESPTNKNVEAEKAFAVWMAEKAKEFKEKGLKIYHGNLPEGVKEHH